MNAIKIVKKNEYTEEDHEDNECLYFGGIPTNIELNKLKKAYPTDGLKPGVFIPYSDIENLLNLDWKAPRFKTVTNRWRKHVEGETNIFIHPVPGEGFKILNEEEKFALAKNKIVSSGKQARRSFVINNRVDRKALSQDLQKEWDHVNLVAGKIHASTQIKSRIKLPEI